jgi:hypothetical protein
VFNKQKDFFPKHRYCNRPDDLVFPSECYS